MKKVMLSLALVLATMPVLAQHHHGHHGHHGGHWARGNGGGWTWMVPALIGGAIIYEAARNQPPMVVQQPVIVQNPPVVVQQNCSPWTETQHADGTITRTRTCQQ